MPEKDLRSSPMMQHLLDALARGEDIGHYGRLVFAMIARHFMDDAEVVAWLSRHGSTSEEEARSLCEQVAAHDYSPPRPDRIRAWQAQQEFPICPTDDPDACNVYRDLKFPQDVYDRIAEYYSEKSEAGGKSDAKAAR